MLKLDCILMGFFVCNTPCELVSNKIYAHEVLQHWHLLSHEVLTSLIGVLIIQYTVYSIFQILRMMF